MAQQPHNGPRPPHYQGFKITFRNTTIGMTPLDEWSARRRDLYLTTHNTHNRHTYPPVGFKPTVSAGERPQTPRLRPRGHWDLHRKSLEQTTPIIFCVLLSALRLNTLPINRTVGISWHILLFANNGLLVNSHPFPLLFDICIHECGPQGSP